MSSTCRDLSLTCLGSVETGESYLFVFLCSVWNSLAFFIPCDPFLSLPLLGPSTPPQPRSKLKDLLGEYHSHQGLIIIIKIDPIWCLQRWGARPWCLQTPQGWCGNTTPFVFISNPWDELSLLEPRISTPLALLELPAMLFPFLQLCFKSTGIQKFEKLLKIHFMWSRAYRIHAPIYLWALAYSY